MIPTGCGSPTLFHSILFPRKDFFVFLILIILLFVNYLNYSLFSIRSGDSSVLTSVWERLFTNIVMFYETYTKEGKGGRKSLSHTQWTEDCWKQ